MKKNDNGKKKRKKVRKHTQKRNKNKGRSATHCVPTDAEYINGSINAKSTILSM